MAVVDARATRICHHHREVRVSGWGAGGNAVVLVRVSRGCRRNEVPRDTPNVGAAAVGAGARATEISFVRSGGGHIPTAVCGCVPQESCTASIGTSELVAVGTRRSSRQNKVDIRIIKVETWIVSSNYVLQCKV
jgi:hypothetical protein